MRMRYPGLVFLAVLSILAFSGSESLGRPPKGNFVAISATDTPTPSIDPASFSALPEGGLGPSLNTDGNGALTPGLSGPAIECYNFNDNPTFNGGFLFIPPDPHCAAGLTHVINIGNCIIEWRPKNAPLDVPQYRNSLAGFFAGTVGTLGTTAFDPKVVYDQYRDRFIVVALEVLGGPPLQSRILVGISKGADPNGGWWTYAINSMVPTAPPAGGAVVDRYADYPGLAIDDEAVYVCNNMFSAAGAYGGVRLWIINKAPAYAGGVIVAPVYDPYGLSGQPLYATTTQPTHMYGPEPAGVGTYLVSYSGLSDGVDEYIDIIQVDSPNLLPVFTFNQLGPFGNIDDTALALIDAPQLGGAPPIEVNDRRALNAVWRNNNLYMCATVRATTAADLAQTTAHWWRVDTIGFTVADQGDVGANDLGAGGTYTFMASVMVDQCDNMAIGFAASNASIYCGAYYATRLASDAPGTIGLTGTLQAGTDWYNRFFSGPRNRWGDYSGLSICPVDQATFWVYNEYACLQGTPTGTPAQTGRWCTKLGKFFVCQPVSVAITAFDAIAKDGAVELRSLFRSDLGVEAVNVYRAGAEGEFRLIETVYTGGTSFVFTDDTVAPGATYRYQIGVVDGDGEVFSPIAKVSLAGVSVALGQNSPNPFNPSTTISFTLPAREQVTVSIYDANGRLVRTLLNDSRDYGTHSVTWDGRDDAGTTVGSGVYFYRLSAGKYSESKKMVMLK